MPARQQVTSTGTNSKRSGSLSRITSTMVTTSSWTVSPQSERRRGRKCSTCQAGPASERAQRSTFVVWKPRGRRSLPPPVLQLLPLALDPIPVASPRTLQGVGAAAHEATGYAESCQRCTSTRLPGQPHKQQRRRGWGGGGAYAAPAKA